MTHGTSADADLEALHFIAEGITALAGFGVATVSIVEGDELRTLAVVGDDDATRALMELKTPVSAMLAELEPAEDWGRLRFLPHEREAHHLRDFEWVPAIDRIDADDAWHPRDLLCALLHDDAGRLRGILAVDLPRSRRRPTAEQRTVLDHYAAQAEKAVVAFVERRRLARDLRAEQELSRYRARLMDVLAHELQTPVTTILGHTEIALDDPSAPSVLGDLQAIERSGRRISSMAQDLLQMARVDNPDRPVEPVPVDLAAVARTARDQLDLQADHRHIGVEVTAPDGPVVVAGDPDEVGVLVSNLVSNAVKYSRPGGRVTVDVTDEGAEGAGGAEGGVVLRVADEGIGISQEDQARLFDEFYRSPSEAVREMPGNGLGLAIVRRIVERHHARLDLTSTLGVGTVVTVTFAAAAP